MHSPHVLCYFLTECVAQKLYSVQYSTVSADF
jgi:hypothetical protein